MTRHVVVLGGGISGLSAAWYLTQQPDTAVTILEKSSRPGGWIQSIRQDGFLFELGARSCRTRGSGTATLSLCEELGLQDQVIAPSRYASQRFIYTGQRLRPVPKGPMGFLLSSLTRPLIWPLLNEWRVPPCPEPDESIHSFFSRRLGPYAADTLIDPLTSGIYAGATRSLSVAACFPAVHKLEQEQGCLVKGAFRKKRKQSAPVSAFVQSAAKKSLFTFRGGMQQLTDTLALQLADNLRLNCPVQRLQFEEEGVQVELSSGDRLFADQVISTLPAPALAPLVAPLDLLLSQSLAAQQRASVVVVSVGYRKKVLPREGFGYLVPSREGERLLGVVWDSSAFPQHNHYIEETRLTCMFGGRHLPDSAVYSEEDYHNMARESLQRHLGIQDQPDAYHVHRANQAIPQYPVGHAQLATHWRKRLRYLSPYLFCLGNSFDGVSINDCIASAKQLIQSDMVLAS